MREPKDFKTMSPAERRAAVAAARVEPGQRPADVAEEVEAFIENAPRR